MSLRRKKNIAELTLCSLSQYRESSKLPLLLVADNVRSMHNVGAMLRTSDALGIEGMVMCGITGCPPHPEISKSALGAEESVAWRHAADAFAEAEGLKERGWKICVLEQAHGSLPLRHFLPEPGVAYALVVGNEVKGVDQRIVDMADYVLEIPQCGVKHSLNVSVSAGIALWHITSSMREGMPG